MKKRNFLFFKFFVVTLFCLILFPGAASAQFEFQYAAKFICGVNTNSTLQVLPGWYATAITIHNPNNATVGYRKRIALSFPSRNDALPEFPGLFSEWIDGGLGFDRAVEIDCNEIPKEFFPNRNFGGLVRGFLRIQSNRPIDVTAVYTVGKPSFNSDGEITDDRPFAVSIDVEQIPERELP